MAEILPFRALHYNPAVAGELARVVTQPYDKITPAMQSRYLQLSPHNLAHIIRGEEFPADTAQSNVYTRAAQYLGEWIRDGALVAESEPGIFPYHQDYAAPGRPPTEARRERRGFIALLRLEDYNARIVHRHEETLRGPKADRLELLKHTRAHFGQLFMLYSDAAGEIEHALAEATAARAFERVEDEYGTRHSVWRVTREATIQRVAEAMREKKLVIADGHHRYETALAYRDLCRAEKREDSRADYVMATFVRIETSGLTILPTHRVLDGLAGFDFERLLAEAAAFFECEAIAGGLEGMLERLRSSGSRQPTLLAYGGSKRAALMRLRPDAPLPEALADVPEGLRRVDVVLLHRLLLEKALGVSREAVRDERHLRYAREAEEAAAEVESGRAQLAFLLNPTPIREVWENALAGNVLPQKSTDFYPKLLSGLTAYWLDHRAGI